MELLTVSIFDKGKDILTFIVECFRINLYNYNQKEFMLVMKRGNQDGRIQV